MLENELTTFFETAEMLCVRGIDNKKDGHQFDHSSSVPTTNLSTVKEEPPEDLNNSDNDEELHFEPEKLNQQTINPFNQSISRISGSHFDEDNHESANSENGKTTNNVFN